MINKTAEKEGMLCFRTEQTSVIKFLVAEGCKAIEIHTKMATVYHNV